VVLEVSVGGKIQTHKAKVFQDLSQTMSLKDHTVDH
jgi:hypothetical protein